MTADEIHIDLLPGKKIFFLSDFHLGASRLPECREREKRIVDLLKAREEEIGALFLLGDIFDYWFEYRFVVPKGFLRFFGMVAGFCDKGIPVHFFGGNHDFWTGDYFDEELGMHTHKHYARLHVGGYVFLVGHGDGLDPEEKRYRCIKAVFDAPASKRIYAALHPCWGYRLAHAFSRESRKKSDRRYQKREQNPKKQHNQLFFMQEYLKNEPVDAFIFGHRHNPWIGEISSQGTKPLPLHADLPEKGGSNGDNKKNTALYLNTGDWLQHDSYVVFDGKSFRLEGRQLPQSLTDCTGPNGKQDFPLSKEAGS